MDVMDIVIAADGIRDEDILDAEAAAGLWTEGTAPARRKRSARRALYVLLPAAAGIALVAGVLGNMRMGSSGGSSGSGAFSAPAAAEEREYSEEIAPEAVPEKDADVKGAANAAGEMPAEAENGGAVTAGGADAAEGASPEETGGAVTADGAVTTGGAAEGASPEAAAAQSVRMVFAGGKLYVEEGPADTLGCGTYDFTIERTVPETETPAEDFTANFAAEGGMYLDKDRIAVYADGSWYVFILKEQEVEK